MPQSSRGDSQETSDNQAQVGWVAHRRLEPWSHPRWPRQAVHSIQTRYWEAMTSNGPSIKYVTLFLANFDPPPPVTLCHTSRDPPKVRHTSRTTPRFLVGLVQKSRIKVPCKILSQLFAEVFVRGVLSWLVFVRSPFCHNTSVTTES